LAYYGGLCLHLLGCFPAPHATGANEPPIRLISRVTNPGGGCYYLSLSQMILLAHLETEFKKKGDCRRRCGGYRPDTVEMIYRHISTRQLRVDELSRLIAP
jgi:hypothetical protein